MFELLKLSKFYGASEAIEIAKGCPILAAGGSVELALTVEM